MTGRHDALHLAELLCARMTHDFSGSIGALSNLLDLAFDQPERAAEPLALASETAGQLVRRLKLLRAAWGPPMEPFPLGRIHDLALGLAQSRCCVNLEALAGGTEFSMEHGRLVLNLLLMAADGLPSGGEVALRGCAGDLVLVIAGQRAAWPAGLAACIADPDSAWSMLEDPRKVQTALTVLLAASLGMRLSLLMGPEAGGVPPLRIRTA
ncbi:MAG TPA: histidine phosphotransferase family protein [Acetobacteraceae bacterium]|nr:histidine phosphotransferase family protein [Acetobacteraceae bacterium]